MQGKGIIKFFLVLLSIVCLIQYLYMLPTRKVENRADAYAQSLADEASSEAEQSTIFKAAKAAYLDSMSSEEIFKIPLIKSWSYEELKKAQLAFGLDLKGGMSTVLQVDLRELIYSLANNSKDPTFSEALNNADDALKSAQSDYVTLFAQEWAKVKGDKKLSTIFSRSATLKDEINFETSDNEVIKILRTKANETVSMTFQRLKDRIDKFGVSQPNVTLDEARDLITVELPGIDNPERARNFLQATAKLEFWDVYRATDQGVMQAFIDADAKLKRVSSGDTTLVEEEPEEQTEMVITPIQDTLGNDIGFDTSYAPIAGGVDPLQNQGPLFQIFTPNFTAGGQGLSYWYPVMGVAEKNKRNAVMEMINRPDIKPLFPKDLKLYWGADPILDADTRKPTTQYELYGIKAPRGRDRAPLEGDLVINATTNPDPVTGEVLVNLSLDNKGAKIWADMTTKAAQNSNREIAIVLDDEVVSAPSVNEPILSGDSRISGNFSIQEGKDLANILQVGKLPAKTKIIQESLVGPSLGAKNIRNSLLSMVIGFSLVLVFMILYYGSAGIVAIIALLANLFFIFGALASFGTVLTVPGIAGILLTIGMAVDANVIIFERIREELREGKGLKLAVADGFKYSYSAIIDANVTTILVAFVLAYFGLGPIKGFATVLIIGVLSSLFTAVLLGRLIIEWWLGKDRNLTFWTPATKNVLAKLNIDWLSKRKIAYVISGILLVLSFIGFFSRGFELGVDFKGGYSYNVEFAQDAEVSVDQLRSTLSDAFGGLPVVKAVDTENTFNITTSYLVNETSEEAPQLVMEKLFEGVNAVVGGNIDFEQFKLPDGTGTHISQSAKVGPTIADDIKKSSVEATIFALILIFLYIFVRFNKWQYSMGAVAALFHDTIIVMGMFALFHGVLPFSMEIDQAFIAALLTVIGYSINDTVVVFDRIREFMGLYTNKSKEEVINMAVNSTVSRTIITSLTTLLVVAMLFIFGGGSIKGFAFALLIGILVGTYSSIFVATPLMSDFTGELKARDSKKSSFSRAARV
jgi:SecD/SecF fusion protein